MAAVAPAQAVAGAPSPLSDITPHLTAEAPLRSGSAAAAVNADGIAAAPLASRAPAPAGDTDGEGMRQYRLALAREARRYKRYPARALEASVSGTAEIRIAVAAGGLAENVQLARSSGDDGLDDAALDMIRKAVRRAAVPEPLRDRAFAVSLPVVFDLASE